MSSYLSTQFKYSFALSYDQYGPHAIFMENNKKKGSVCGPYALKW